MARWWGAGLVVGALMSRVLWAAGVEPAEQAASARPDWVIRIDRTRTGDRLDPALLGQYDLSGALFGYDTKPAIATALRRAGVTEWRVSAGRWEIGTRLLRSLSSGKACDFPFRHAFLPEGSTDEELLAGRDWFVSREATLNSPFASQEPPYELGYARSVIDTALRMGLSPFVSIDNMPRALAANRVPARTDCLNTFTNGVSNSPPVDPRLFAQAATGLVKSIIEGDSRERGRPVQYWEFWNEPDLPLFWVPEPDGKIDRYFDTATWTLLTLAEYRRTSTHPAARTLRFGLGGFSSAAVAAAALKAYDERPLPNGAPLPIDFLSFHSYSNDPLRIVADIATVASARASTRHYRSVQLVLSEWGPDLETGGKDPIYAAGLEPSLSAATVIAMGSALGLSRAHRALIWDYFPVQMGLGLLDHSYNPRPIIDAYGLLSVALAGGADRLVPLGLQDAALEGGKGAILATVRHDSRVCILLVNRNEGQRLAEVQIDSGAVAPARVRVLADPKRGVVPGRVLNGALVVPAHSIVLAEF